VTIRRAAAIGGWLLQRLAALVLAALLTLAVFLVLPLIQTIGAAAHERDLTLRSVGVAALPPPPPPPPAEEPPPRPEPPPAPPEPLAEAPLDLAQLELALDPGFGAGLFGDFTLRLTDHLDADPGLAEVFSLADLDRRPNVVVQPHPTYPAELKRTNRRGTVYVVFLVDERGRVSGPRVEQSTDPAFDAAALEAVRQWRFEPGTRRGQAVPFTMRVPITFNAG